MRFAVDLDSTLVDIPVLERACLDVGEPGRFTMRDARDWCFTTIPPKIRKRVYELFADPEFMNNLCPSAGAQSLISKLRHFEHDVKIVTCRSAEVAKGTITMVTKLFPGTDVVVLPATESKMGLFRDMRIHAVIDDSPVHIASAYMAGVPRVYMYYSEFTPYNRMVPGPKYDMPALLVMATNDEWPVV